MIVERKNLSGSHMCTADPTGLPYSFGIDSLQSHLIIYTGTPGNSNHNRLLCVHMRIVRREVSSDRILAQLTKLAYRSHTVPTVCRHT